MKKRIFSLCLAILVFATLLPQISAFAVTSGEVDAALKLADKGKMYVSANSLPKTATIGGTDYPVTYESDIPSIISADGTVSHGELFQYVTVTPKISSGNQTVSGTSQRLLVLPAGGNELFFEDFEDFNAGPIKNDAITNGWQCNYDEATQKAEILNDNTKYYHAQVTTAGHAYQNVRLYTYHDSMQSTGYTLVALRANIGSSNSSTTDGFFIAHTAFFDNANLTGGNGLTSVSLPGYTNSWHDFLFVIDNEDTVVEEGTLARKMSVFMDGEYKGSMYSYPEAANFLLLQLARFYTHEASADDILIMNMAAPDIEVGNLGGHYAKTGKLPVSKTVYGTQSTLTYISEQPSLISNDGTVTGEFNFKYTTVTPKINYRGATIKGKPQQLLVLPQSYEEVFFDDFEAAAYQADGSEKVINPSTTVNGWTSSAYTLSDASKISAIMDSSGDTALKIVNTSAGTASKIGVERAMENKSTGVTVLAAAMNINSTGDAAKCFELLPIGNIDSESGVFASASDGSLTTGNVATLTTGNTAGSEHAWMFVIDNESTVIRSGVTLKQVTVYLDGTMVGRCYTKSATNLLSMALDKAQAGSATIDDVLIYNLEEFVMTDKEKAEYIAEKITKSALTTETNGAITKSLTLSTNYKDFYADADNKFTGTTISWSADSSAIGSNGSINRGDIPQSVKVTATVRVGDKTADKSFYFTVAPAGSKSFSNGKFDLDFNSLKVFEDASAGWAFDNSSAMSVTAAKNPREDSVALKITNSSSSQLGLKYMHEDSANCGEFGKNYAFGCDLAFFPDANATNGKRVFFEINGAALEARVGLDFETDGVYLLFNQNDYIFSKRHLNLEPGEWFHFDIEFNTAKKSFIVYINGIEIFANPISMNDLLWTARRPFRSLGFRMSGNSTMYVDNMYAREYDYAEALDENADFTVTSFTLTNQNGTMIKNLTSDTTKVNAKIRLVKNRPTEDTEATLLLAHYDASGALIDIVKKDIEESKVEGTVGYPDITMTLNLTGDCTGHMVKAFVMRLDSIQPVTEMVSLENEIVFDKERLLSETPAYRPAAELGYTEADDSSVYPQIQEIMFDGEPYKGNPTKHFAYLGLPAGASAANPVPAVVVVHGGGGTAYDQFVAEWNRRGYAAIAMDLNGCVPDVNAPDARRKHAWAGPWQDNYTDLYSQENVWMYHAVTAVIKSHSILRNMPEIDSSKIGVTGVSWGSVVTCTTLGVDDRFAFAIPVYGCGFLYESKTYMSDLMTREKMAWDASNFVKKSNLPVLWITGDRDPAFDINVYTKTASLVGDRGTMCIIPNFRHDHPDAWAREEVYAFADSIVRNGKKLVRPGEVTVSGNKATVTLDIPSGRSINNIKLYYTTSDITYHEDGSTALYTYSESTSYTVSGSTYTFNIPQGTKHFYVDFTDSTGLMTSTKLVTID